MKTTALVLTLLCCSFMHSFPQNRIHTWKTEKIRSIEVECTVTGDETITVSMFLDTQENIDAIINFLKEVEFLEIIEIAPDVKKPSSAPDYRIIFEGLRDEVWLFEGSAYIGKTWFLMDKGVLVEFEKLIDTLWL